MMKKMADKEKLDRLHHNISLGFQWLNQYTFGT